jgi:hypothetical protein
MPGKANKKNPKSPAGNSGLTTETTSLEQNPDQTMSPNASSVAAQQLPLLEKQAKESDAVIKAFEDLFDLSDEENAKAVPPPHAKKKVGSTIGADLKAVTNSDCWRQTVMENTC